MVDPPPLQEGIEATLKRESALLRVIDLLFEPGIEIMGTSDAFTETLVKAVAHFPKKLHRVAEKLYMFPASK
jgi:hypothetical protein